MFVNYRNMFKLHAILINFWDQNVVLFHLKLFDVVDVLDSYRVFLCSNILIV